MNDESSPRRRVVRLSLTAATVLVVGALCSPATWAQPRFYWKTLSGANAIPLIVTSASGNTNPFDPALTVEPGANVDATVSLFGYARTFSLFNRAAMASVILPMGRISGEIAANVQTVTQTANGFGDPMFEFDINVLGPPAQKTLVDALRYQPKFSLDLIADLAVPIGEYDSSQPLNLGQNRWYGRVGAPIIWQLGPWVPGRRTTLEFLPAVWWFTANDNYDGGKSLTTDPLFELDAHLTRDFTERLWGSFDGVWYNGGQSSIDGVGGERLDNIALGLTLGYQINDNVTLMFGYKSTIADSAPSDLRMDGFTVTLLSGWHALVEGVRRLQEE
jgi:hypothetical protein